MRSSFSKGPFTSEERGRGGIFRAHLKIHLKMDLPTYFSAVMIFIFCFILLGLKHYWGVQHFQILIIDLVFGGGRGLFFQYLQLCDQSDQKCPEVSTIKLPLDLLVNMYTQLFFCFFFKCTDFSLLFPWLVFLSLHHYKTLWLIGYCSRGLMLKSVMVKK